MTDRKPIGLRDTAAYMKLLPRPATTARPISLERPVATSSSSISGASPRESRSAGPPSWDRVPDHPGALEEDAIGRLYTATIVTPDSSPNPYFCVFEDAPANLPLGDKLSERVVFNGYFLKLLAYEAHDRERGTPLIIGKLGWTSEAAAPEDPNRPIRWLLLGIGVMFVISFLRWITAFRRSLQVRRTPSLLRDRPTEEISSEDRPVICRLLIAKRARPLENDSQS